MEPLLKQVEEYGKTSYELLRLKTLDKIARTTSIVVIRSVFIIILFTFKFLLTIGVAFWLGDLLGKTYYGFFCVAGFYLVVGGICFFMRKQIKKSISNSIISHLLN